MYRYMEYIVYTARDSGTEPARHLPEPVIKFLL